MDDRMFALVTGCSAATARDWAGPITNAMAEREIDTPDRIAAFLAQLGHESGGFRHVREKWGPTPAQQNYEGRAALGNTQRGDGKRYMGRGPIQITGRANYAACGKALGLDLIAQPELLEAPPIGARAAAWFWSDRGLNSLADVGDFGAITRRINGGMNGHDDRVDRWLRARRYLLGGAQS